MRYFKSQSEIKVPEFSPAEYEKIEKIIENKLRVAVSATCIGILENHVDNSVRDTAKMLKETISPFITTLDVELPKPSKIDYYELALPTGTEVVSIGFNESATLKVPPSSFDGNKNVNLNIRKTVQTEDISSSSNEDLFYMTIGNNISVSVCFDSSASPLEFKTITGAGKVEVGPRSIIKLGLNDIILYEIDNFTL
jgi:hypothetical protein